MKNSITIHAHYIDQLNGALDSLAYDLKKIGIEVEFKKSFVNEHYDVTFSYDLVKLSMKNSRYAGKKRKIMHKRPQYIDIGIVKQNIKKYGREEAANQLGLSYSTMYRRIREAEKKKKNHIEY